MIETSPAVASVSTPSVCPLGMWQGSRVAFLAEVWSVHQGIGVVPQPSAATATAALGPARCRPLPRKGGVRPGQQRGAPRGTPLAPCGAPGEVSAAFASTNWWPPPASRCGASSAIGTMASWPGGNDPVPWCRSPAARGRSSGRGLPPTSNSSDVHPELTASRP